MTSLRDHFRQLLSLTQLYLLQNYALSEKVVTNLEICNIFRKHVILSKKTKPQPLPPPPPAPKRPITVSEKLKPPHIQRKRAALPKEQSKPLAKPLSPSISRSKDRLSVIDQDFSDLKTIIKTQFPHLEVSDKIPSDEQGVTEGSKWKQNEEYPPVVLIAFERIPSTLCFLQNITHAINEHIAKAKLLFADEMNENDWEKISTTKELKFIIAEEQAIKRHHPLNNSPHKGRQLIPLLPLSEYLHSEQNKRALWDLLKKRIS